MSTLGNSTERRELLKVTNIKKYYNIEKGIMHKVSGCLKAVDNVSFVIYEGETLGMVGESGCGKSTIGKSILRAFDITGGSVIFDFDGKSMDVSQFSMRKLRSSGFRKNTQMIFQDPNSSLNPRMTVFDLISEPLVANGLYSKNEMIERVCYLMERVGLDSRYLKRYPYAFSAIHYP